ncbi:hypothetical protein HanXRQr2_Chr12g0523081 [Helianthus annuus]|uniref:Uncharacterized protein n=1 Tax=Helianthus annuus TaxID=4232 RepID=A0A251SYF2_HELAN|nr:hypothetical protein HanXRQr2_Chr12g0523081 [Helianthus annuus]
MVLPLQTLIFISSFFCRSFLFARNQDFKITKNRINNQHNMRETERQRQRRCRRHGAGVSPQLARVLALSTNLSHCSDNPKTSNC